MFVLSFVIHYLVSFLVLQSSLRGRNGCLLCFNRLSRVSCLSVFCGSSSRWVGLQCVTVVSLDHTQLLFDKLKNTGDSFLSYDIKITVKSHFDLKMLSFFHYVRNVVMDGITLHSLSQTTSGYDVITPICDIM